MSDTLDLVLARATADADALKRHGDPRVAGAIAGVVAAVQAAPDLALLEWVSEARARVQTGRGPAFFRARRGAWAERDLARHTPKGWEYRAAALAAVTDAARDEDDPRSLAERLLEGAR